MADKENTSRVTVRLSADEQNKLDELQYELQLKHKSDLIKLLIDTIHNRFQRSKISLRDY